MSHSSDLSKLLGQAAASGTLSQATVAAQTSALGGDLGQIVIAGAAGVDAEDLVASDVTLVTVLVDASTSIHTRGLEDAVMRGYGELVSAFVDARERDSVVLALWTFNDEARVVHSYVPVTDATRLDPSNYRGLGGTKLYDTFCDGVLANVAYAERLRAAGTPTRSIVVVLTEIGLITPPIGMNVFVLKANLPQVPVSTIFRGLVPFVAVDLVRLALLVAFPSISLVLVQLMK